MASDEVGSDLSYRGPSRARSGGVVASRGRVRGGCGVNVAVTGRLGHATRRRAFVPSLLPVNVLVNLTAVNQMDPYDSDSSDGGPEFPSQSLPFNDPNYGTYKRGQQFMIVDHTANQCNGSEI